MKRLATALLMFATAPVQAQPDPAVAFGARENVEFIALSPDGTRVAYAVPRATGQGSRVMTVEVGGAQPRDVIGVDGQRQRLGGCNWVSNARLVCTVFSLSTAHRPRGYRHPAGRARSRRLQRPRARRARHDGPDRRSASGAAMSSIGWRARRINVLMAQAFVPEARSDTLAARSASGSASSRSIPQPAAAAASRRRTPTRCASCRTGRAGSGSWASSRRAAKPAWRGR